jgi:DNA-binding beta-propeller fold protein YncE
MQTVSAAAAACLSICTAGCAVPPAMCTASSTSRAQTALPLCVVTDVAMSGNASRFDYEDLDAANKHLVIAHMGDSIVSIVNVDDGGVVADVPNVGTVRGVLAAPEANRLFASASSSDELVSIDATTLREVSRVSTGAGPDGIAFDPADDVVAVSAQGAGQVTLLAAHGDGKRSDVDVGSDTGNVVFDATRGHFFATATGPDQIVEIDPTRGGKVLRMIVVPGCAGAHGLKLDLEAKTALVACEVNATLVRIDLDGEHASVSAGTGLEPDVLAIDPGFGWLYVAAESGDLKVFDIRRAGLFEIDSEHPGDNAHSVVVDPATHRAFFPLADGGEGRPVLRIMRP